MQFHVLGTNKHASSHEQAAHARQSLRAASGGGGAADATAAEAAAPPFDAAPRGSGAAGAEVVATGDPGAMLMLLFMPGWVIFLVALLFLRCLKMPWEAVMLHLLVNALSNCS